MSSVALVLYGVWAAVALVGRALLQRRRTGDTGIRRPRPEPGQLLLVAGIAVGAAAPAVDLASGLEPLAALDHGAVNVVGAVLAVLGIAGTIAAQLAMGDSWRVGVDPGERTALVTHGPFRLVRNPIYTTMIATVAGAALMVPNVLAVIAAVIVTAGLQLHVRRVEEPYLLATHGAAYADYAARVGRFLPAIGCITL